MIDFLKVEVLNYPRKQLLVNPCLDFKGSYSMSTGDIEEWKIIAEYNGMKFISLNNDKLFIQGSIHKFYNAVSNIYAPNQFSVFEKTKGFNGNILSLTQLKFAVGYLCRLIKIRPEETILRGFEYGLNIEIDYPCNTFLNGLFQHKNKIFSSVKDVSHYYRHAKYQRFIIKCYDKQIQYDLKSSTIRFEVKLMKMISLSSVNIKYLSDLILKDNLERLKYLLLKRWDEVLIYDKKINISKLSTKEKEWLKDYSDLFYWENINRNHTYRPKMRLQQLSENYGCNIQFEFKKQLEKQWDKQNQNCVTFNILYSSKKV